jgi:hypothetical protein
MGLSLMNRGNCQLAYCPPTKYVLQRTGFLDETFYQSYFAKHRQHQVGGTIMSMLMCDVLCPPPLPVHVSCCTEPLIP